MKSYSHDFKANTNQNKPCDRTVHHFGFGRIINIFGIFWQSLVCSKCYIHHHIEFCSNKTRKCNPPTKYRKNSTTYTPLRFWHGQHAKRLHKKPALFLRWGNVTFHGYSGNMREPVPQQTWGANCSWTKITTLEINFRKNSFGSHNTKKHTCPGGHANQDVQRRTCTRSNFSPFPTMNLGLSLKALPLRLSASPTSAWSMPVCTFPKPWAEHGRPSTFFKLFLFGSL